MPNQNTDTDLRLFAATIEKLDVNARVFYLELLLSCGFNLQTLCENSGLQLKKNNDISIIETDLTKFLIKMSKLSVKKRKKEIEKQIKIWLYPDLNSVNNDKTEYTTWEKIKFNEILNEIQENQQCFVKELITSGNMKVNEIRELLELPSLPPDDVDPDTIEYGACKEFEIILSEQLPVNKHEQALILLKENKYNVQKTCDQLGIKRFQSKTSNKSKGPMIHILSRTTKKESHDIAGVWPDNVNQKKALFDLQMKHHPSIIDLHYYTLEEADECVEEFIKYHKSLRTPQVIIITGKGNNSETRKTIRHQTISYLKNEKIVFKHNQKNTGQLVVILFPH